MNQNQNTGSISRRLRLEWWISRFSGYLAFDALGTVLFVLVWCVNQVVTTLGSFPMQYQHWQFSGDFSDGFVQGLKTMVFDFTVDKHTYTAAWEYTFYLLYWCLMIILAFQVIGLIGEVSAGYYRAQKIMSPFAKMATATVALTNAQQQPPTQDYNYLQHAIEGLNPELGDGLLHTGSPELCELEQAINDLLTRMRKSYADQTRFVSDASHELRTPIAVIQGYANMLDRWGKEDQGVLDEGIQAIKAESQQMKTLVEQLLFLARGDSGRQQMKKEDVSLQALLQDVLEESQMISPQFSWAIDIKQDAVVSADYGLLKQAVRILVDNATKYTPQGQEIMLMLFYDEKNQPTIGVQDMGTGIKKEDLDKVFERFFRSDDARDRQSGGTGLGLSIAKWIVARHGGYFSLTSVPALGSRFCIHIPK